MSPYGRNVLANLVGVGWSTLVLLVCVPFYLRLIGMESYALVGFSLTVQATLLILDLGLTPTLSRELARTLGSSPSTGEVRSFVRTLELVSWGLGSFLGGLVVLGAPWIATHWVQAGSLPVAEVTVAMRLMGGMVALQWPLSFYQAGLQGLGQQLPLNLIRVVASTAIGGGSVAVLALLSPDLRTFFSWQVLATLAQVVALAVFLWRRLPAQASPVRARLELLRPVLGFTTGMGAVTVFAMLLIQMDKLVLSRLLPLDAFGAYVLAGTVVNGLQLFVRPLFNATFPALSTMVAAADVAGERRLYHQGTQLMAVLVLPAASVLGLFSYEVLLAWVGDPPLARQAAPLVSTLVVGTALHGLMHLPYALQLAHAWTRVSLVSTVGMVIVTLPLLLWGATQRGALAAAGVWVLINILNVAVGLPWTHARLLRGDAWRWLFGDVAPPLVGALAVGGFARVLAPSSPSRVEAVVLLVVVATATALVAALVTPVTRGWLRRA